MVNVVTNLSSNNGYIYYDDDVLEDILVLLSL